MKTVMIIPTYNEKENIKEVITRLLALNQKELYILIVDDNSPDGTADIVRSLIKKWKKIHLLFRPKGKGRGSACIEGYKKAIEMGAEYIGEMDADLSHHPEQLPRLQEAIKHADVVLGSRLVKGGKDEGRSYFRTWVTKASCLYTRTMLGVKVKDTNSGYRLYKKKIIEQMPWREMKATHHNHVQETLYKMHLMGFKIMEVPITFSERTKGKSKVTLKHMLRGFTTVAKLRLRHLTGQF